MGSGLKSMFGYIFVFIIAFMISTFYYHKVLNDPQIIRIFELETINCKL